MLGCGYFYLGVGFLGWVTELASALVHLLQHWPYIHQWPVQSTYSTNLLEVSVLIHTLLHLRRGSDTHNALAGCSVAEQPFLCVQTPLDCTYFLLPFS